jgi:hypothetical protein
LIVEFGGELAQPRAQDHRRIEVFDTATRQLGSLIKCSCPFCCILIWKGWEGGRRRTYSSGLRFVSSYDSGFGPNHKCIEHNITGNHVADDLSGMAIGEFSTLGRDDKGYATRVLPPSQVL